MADDAGQDKRKQHRARQSGVKADKKKEKVKRDSNQKEPELTARQRNPKAFAINSAQRAERNFRRKEDLTAKKQHIPVVDQTPDEPPPVLIAVVGPPKVGKTTLIKDLIKTFTRTNVTEIKGAITIVTSKKRRITLLECNNDVNSMIDVAKCADLVLLLCDASYGFEMEIFEFLNICQVHGMPKIMGVLTHLDMIKNPKQLRKRKKELKHRFWTEVYDGAKLFYLSGLLHGEYLRNEIKNLGRFISVMKFRPLQWRGAHSYLLVDRMEDVTNTDQVRRNPKCDREVVLYGYVRGVPLKQEHMVHIAGLGDARIDELSVIPDPCPLPGTEKKRSLLEKERLLYAPMSGVGGIVYDKDAVYIELQGSHSHSHKEKTAEATEQEELVNRLIDKKATMDQQMEQQEFRLFSDGAPIKSKDFRSDDEAAQSSEDEDDDEGDDSGLEAAASDDEQEEQEEEFDANDWRGENSDDDEDSDAQAADSDDGSSGDEEYQSLGAAPAGSGSESDAEEDDEEARVLASNMSWKTNLAQKARDAFLQRHSESKNLMRLVYGGYNQSERSREDQQEQEYANDSDEELGGLFRVAAKKQSEQLKDKDIRDKEERCFFEYQGGATRDWLSEENKPLIKNCFVTGKWKASEDAENLLKMDDMSDAESEVYGDFEDLETGEQHSGKPKPEKADDSDSEEAKPEEAAASGKRKMTRVEEENLTKADLMAKKLKLKAKFDAEYDNTGEKGGEEDTGRITGDHSFYEDLKAEAQKQSELNKTEFAHLDNEFRIQIEGYRPGMYVRLGFKTIPAEFVENFDASYPVLVGALNMTEENVGYVNCKVKKHRWYKKILKTGDPLIVSMGWRRFQTVAIYAKVEDNFRHRYLKYTPNHVTCSMTFWGPITPQNTGFLALQTVRQDQDEMKRLGFRIAATGCVTELDKSSQIMKKLKLVGHPFKIFKKTAFVKDMFNSSLEVAKFEGAKIKTVSGIRGQIKKAHHTPEGSYRATFEDKILLSDIVFCRTWFRVDVPRFYAPVTSLLLPPEQKSHWQGMKTLGTLKRERALQSEAQPDSMYKEIERKEKIFRPLTIPKALQRALPYKDKPKMAPEHAKKSLERVAVINSPYEQKVAKMMKMITTNYKDKKNRDRLETRQRMQKFREKKKSEEASKMKRQKELRKKVSRAISKVRGKQTK
ncbi:ribosome biogenesis protein BMS1 homolog [Drosophila guanche]|uniref:Blast:Unc-112-related protein n=1 Tax=Drosophila guanche TaxID=7266 RepID=A0A3B0KJD0_DROGU|nr:ribosome biogenesis protein BMS1 homolog [Drosophila guanche]SPP85211.1 blast:Unc-112-related protein [Drosophila guanche]